MAWLPINALVPTLVHSSFCHVVRSAPASALSRALCGFVPMKQLRGRRPSPPFQFLVYIQLAKVGGRQ
jgi:hypothetical protein